nr:transposase [Nitrosomonas aestuarii]
MTSMISPIQTIGAMVIPARLYEQKMVRFNLTHHVTDRETLNRRLLKKHKMRSTLLDALYAIVYLDCILFKICLDKRVIKKAVHLASGLWLSENESAKFWLNVLTEFQDRGVKRYSGCLC